MDENAPLPPDPTPTPEVKEPEAPPANEPAADEAGPATPEGSAAAEPAAAGLPAPEPAAPEPLLLPGHEPEPESEHAPEAPLPEEPPHAAEHEPVHPEHDHLAQENARRLEGELEALRIGHVEGGRREFRAFFEHERRLHGLFKEVRPLHPHDRHRLWKALKQMGAEVRRAQQEEWESRRYQSLEARETVDEKLRTAEALTQAAEDGGSYRRAESLLNEIRNLLASAAPGSTGQLLIGPDRRACWDRWRAVRDELRKKHGGRQEEAYRAMAALVAQAAAQAGEADPFRVTQRIKELQAQLGKADLRRGQFEELRKRLSAAWQQAQGRMTGVRHERAQQRSEWRARMEQHLGRWRQTLQQKRGQLEHLVEQAAKLIEMEKRARSEDFAEQVRQWQAATAEKRRRTEESIAELEQRIRETEKRTGGARRAKAAKPAAATPPETAASPEPLREPQPPAAAPEPPEPPEPPASPEPPVES